MEGPWRSPGAFLRNGLGCGTLRIWGDTIMKEPGLDGRHRDKAAPKSGEIQQKRGDTLNKNLPVPVPQFSPNAKLSTMRKETGKTSVEDVRREARRVRPDG